MHICSQFSDRVSHSSLCNVRPAGDGEVANNVRILSELGTVEKLQSAPSLRQFCTVYNTGQVQLNSYTASSATYLPSFNCRSTTIFKHFNDHRLYKTVLYFTINHLQKLTSYSLHTLTGWSGYKSIRTAIILQHCHNKL